MSRAYRIRVKESVSRSLSAEDRVATNLELLEILPCEEMAELLEQELEGRGFERDGEKLVRRDGGVTVEIDPKTGEVSVAAAEKQDVDLELEGEGRGWDDVGPGSDNVRKEVGERLRKDLEKQVEREAERLQEKATEKLEGHLRDLQGELDKAINRVTAEALKRKAASMGDIKEITEDEQTGSLTIKVEV